MYKFFLSTKTHNYKSKIDVIILNTRIFPNIKKYYIESSLHTISDYKTIIITVKVEPEFCKKNSKKKFQLKKLDEKQFLAFLKR